MKIIGPWARPYKDLFFLNSGSTVIHAITGKKTIGTVRPGNNSGYGVESGRVIAMGIITQADIVTDTKLKITGPRSLNRADSNIKIRPATNDTMRFRPIKLPGLTIAE